MKYAKKILILLCTFTLTINMHPAVADLNADAEVILNWGEHQFPEFLSPHDTTKSYDIWLYRHYPMTGVYAGINTQDNGVYVKGGIFGDTPVYYKSVSDVLNMISALLNVPFT